MPLLLALLLIPLLVIVLIPVSLMQRIRRGTMRRQARGWMVTANAIGVTLSTAMLLIGALITTRWVPEALRYALGGLVLGAVLGLIGFALTRWESSRGVVHYTPNRWLVLTVTTLVAGRIFYGVWRVWAAWQGGVEPIAAVAVPGITMSIAAGAVVPGYYLLYWIAVHRRLRSSRTRRPRAARSFSGGQFGRRGV
jgi:hypothetical protein